MSGDPQAVQRFQREMKLIGGLSSPHVVRAYNAGEEQGQLYLAMEYVDGVTLQQLVKQNGPLPIGVAAEVIRQAAVGLQHAYEKGLVHRDIKPGNLMLSVDGEVKLLDLGLGRLRADLDATRQMEHPDLSVAGMAMGTVDYMAPEQWRDSSKVDIRADIYALGCTLVYLIAGRPPFSGEEFPTDRDKLHAHTTAPPPKLQDLRPGVPEELDWLLDRLLAKDPDERFDEPLELAQFLAPLRKRKQHAVSHRRRVTRRWSGGRRYCGVSSRIIPVA
jgi:serine/threonine protein kinase